MNKYSLEYLDDKMIFDHAIFRSLSGCIPFSCRLKRMDDFELSMEVESSQEASILPLHDFLNALMSVLAAHFWNADTHYLKKMPVTDISFDLRLPISIDMILVKSRGNEIGVEFFIYQGLVNLYDTALEISRQIGQ